MRKRTARSTAGSARVRDLAGRTVALVALATLLGALAPAFTSVEPAAADGGCGTAPNPIVCENALPGSPQSEWNVGDDGDPTIQGFATEMSVNVGETVHLKVDTAATDYSVKIFRIGYYQGDGARLVDTVTPSVTLPQTQPACLVDPASGLVDCGNWGESASWAVPSDAVSGVYEALLTRTDTDTGSSGAITFVVRDDASDSDILYQTSDATWQAYNTYGGINLYNGASVGYSGAATKVSYNRPLLGRTNAEDGNTFFNAELPMVRFLERNGYDASYFSNVDTDVRGSLIQNHQMFMSSGHDEYWSAAMRSNVQAARDAGVDLSFFSGNSIFWKTIYQPSIDGSGTAGRTLVTYKETHFSGVPSEVNPTGVWTGTWRDPRYASPPDGGYPENELMGGLSTVNGVRNDAVSVPSAYKNMRIWRDTAVAGLAPGATYTMPTGTLGYEWGGDVDNGFRPAGLVNLSSTTIAETLYGAPGSTSDGVGGGVFIEYGHTVGPGPSTNNLTLYRASSGALVFSTQSVQWSWGLDDQHDAAGTPVDVNMQQATVNLFADMGIQPGTLMAGLTAATASSDTTAPTAAITSPAPASEVDTGQPVTITGTATDIGGVVGGIEVSVDGSTWHPAVPTGADGSFSTWSYGWTPSALGSATLRARATDDSANLGAATTTTVTVAYSCPCTIFGASTPTASDSGDATPVELGVKFRSDDDGYVTGVRFYKAAANIGTHTGTLWSSTGAELATATFTGESASGWQEMTFSSPVAITANTTYVASYFAPNGHYAADNAAFTAAGVDTAPLHALHSGVDGPNGVYHPASAGFPTQSYLDSNYWVDPVFTDVPVPDTTPPTVTLTAPDSGATDVATSAVASATFSEDVQAGTVSFELRDAANVLVAGSTAYNAGTRTATFTPAGPLAISTTYTATVSGAEDAAGNALAAPSSWSFTTTSTPPDVTPPTVTVTAPVANATGVSTSAVASATFSEPVQAGTVSFELRDAANVLVAGSTAYNAGSQTATFTPSSPLATSAVYTATVSGAQDTAGNAMSASVSWSFTTTEVASVCPCSIWSAGATPAVAADSDTGAVELGVKFRSDTAGQVTGIRFYKGVGNSGTHTGTLWSSTGTQLATATFSGESASGWQQVTFSSPVAITANTTYVASYFAPNGRYSVTNNGLAAAVDNAPLHALASGASGGNGVYRYGASSSFPTNTYQDSNYWVDVVFTDSVGPDVTPPTVTVTAPVANATGVSTSAVASATFSEPVQAGTVSFELRDAANVLVAGSTAYNAGSQTATFTPSSPLATSAVYTATVSGAQDTAGNAMSASVSWSFTTTEVASACPCSIWSAGATPAVAADSDTGAVELGVKFRSDTAGQVTGIRFYKGVGNSGTHTGTLWSSTGTQLATATFSGESASGWQQVTFSSPVAITANTTYVASYFAPNGRYSVTNNGLAAAVDNAPLHALASGASGGNGVYRYGASSGFPTNTYQDSNYWVDVVFTDSVGPDVTPPTVTVTAPVANATGVSTSAVASATFSEPVQAGTVSFELRDAANVLVAGSTAYNAGSQTATFTPSSPLATSAVYTATVSGAQDTAGNAMSASVSWSFTTTEVASACPCSIWSAGATPAVAADSDTGAVELGVKFRSDTAGQVTGIRFYKGVGNSGTHTGTLWSSTGTQLATATFSGESASGWQQVTFSSPVAITANTTYVASYFAPNGRYSVTNNGLAAAVDNAPLHALASGASGGNGVYRYGASSSFPTNTYQDSNYWVDVVFTDSVGPDVTPPTVTVTAPVANATGVSTSAVASATFSEPVQAGTVSFELRDAANVLVAGSTAYNAGSQTATFTPSSPLATSAVYTATVSGAQDTAGNTLTTPVTWSYTTAAAGATATSIFPNGVTPTLSASGDTGAVELGVKFRSDTAGQVTGIRFYKGVGNSGTHTGTLWSSTGTQLATATFSGESASGWQQVTFSSPVAITANTTYVASYFAPNGNYAVDNDFFTSAGFDNAPLHALASGASGGNGVYQYGSSSSFPTGTYRASNYWVDVVFVAS